MIFFEVGFSFEQLFLQKRNFFRSRHFLSQSLFLTVLCNKFDSIYTLKDFLLTSIHSFKYTMIWYEFEIHQSFIVENSKKRIDLNTG